MSAKHSQFNGDGEQHESKISVPAGLAGGIVTFLLTNGVQIDGAQMANGQVTLTLTVLGAVATMAVMYVLRSLK